MKRKQLQKRIMNEVSETTPKPRWHFLLKKSFIKTLALITLLFGGVAIATIHFMITDRDWSVFHYLDKGLVEHIIESIPYLWIVLFVILCGATIYNFRKTKHGYKYSAVRIITITLIGNIAFGSLLVIANFDHVLHNKLLESVPLYEKLTKTKHDIWVFPEKGLLSGTISTTTKNEFYITDLKGNIWIIYPEEDIKIEDDTGINIGERIRIIGEETGEKTFRARVIEPWGR